MTRNSKTKFGFTLVELLVVFAIIVVLFCLLLPSINVCRDAARRVHCKNNLNQLAVAMHNYNMTFRMLPPGCVNPTGPIESSESGYHMSWLVQLLPCIEQQSLFNTIDFNKSAYDPTNGTVRRALPAVFVCPSSPDWRLSSVWPVSSYVGSTGGIDEPIGENNSGLLFLNSSISYEQIRDGASYTLMLSEREVSDNPSGKELGWMSGTAATLRHSVYSMPAASSAESDTDEIETPRPDFPPEQLTGGFSATHSSINVAFADGSVTTLSGAGKLWRQFGCRDDGELLHEF